MPDARYIEDVCVEWKAAYPDQNVECEPAAAFLATTSKILEKRVEAGLKNLGLVRGEMEVLCAIARSRAGALSPKQVRSRMIVSSGGLTARIDKLEAAGLVVRLADPNDNRGFLIRATEKGREAALAAHRINVSEEKKLLAVLSEKEAVELKRILRKVLEAT